MFCGCSEVYPSLNPQPFDLQDPRHRPSCAEVLRLTELQLHAELSKLRGGGGAGNGAGSAAVRVGR